MYGGTRGPVGKGERMRCPICDKETKDGFPYCMNCGQWIGTNPGRSNPVPGSWGNPDFAEAPRRIFLLRRSDGK